MASPNIKLEVVPTPNPSEVALRVWQDANQMGLDSIPTIGQAYVDTGLPVRPKMEEFKKQIQEQIEDVERRKEKKQR